MFVSMFVTLCSALAIPPRASGGAPEAHSLVQSVHTGSALPYAPLADM